MYLSVLESNKQFCGMIIGWIKILFIVPVSFITVFFKGMIVTLQMQKLIPPDAKDHSNPFIFNAGVTGGSTCHDKRGLHEAPGKSAKTSAPKVCPYSHPSQNSSGSSLGNPLSTSADHCKTTPKHFKTMCRRPTPPGRKRINRSLP